jgi:anti-anti-sigma regulatory factor
VQTAAEAPHVHFAVLADRRNGVDRLTLIGTLDRSGQLLLEREVAELAHAGGALVLDLHNLVVVALDAVRSIRAMARRAKEAGWSLFIVHTRQSVREAFEGVGASDVLSADVSTALAGGGGDWSPISLPPLPGQRVNPTRLRVIEKQLT